MLICNLLKKALSINCVPQHYKEHSCLRVYSLLGDSKSSTTVRVAGTTTETIAAALSSHPRTTSSFSLIVLPPFKGNAPKINPVVLCRPNANLIIAISVPKVNRSIILHQYQNISPFNTKADTVIDSQMSEMCDYSLKDAVLQLP